MGSSLASPARTDLYWIPLGAGGSGFVRLNGRIYEWINARHEGRKPLDLYHTALQVHLPEGCFVVETIWPSPDRNLSSRGVVVEGSVGSHALAHLPGQYVSPHPVVLPQSGPAIVYLLRG